MFTLSFDESLRSILRQAVPAPVPLIQASTLRGLYDALDSFHRDTPWVVSDLSLGAWRGCQVAREFAQQIDVNLEDDPPLIHRPAQRWDDRMPAYADSMGMFVDAESAGDQTVFRAIRHAERLLAAIQQKPPVHLLVILPLGGAEWGRENQWLVRFLAEGAQATPSRLVLISADGTPTPWFDDVPLEPVADTPISADSNTWQPLDTPFVAAPGVICRETAERTPENMREKLRSLPNGCFLVPLEYRRPLKAIARERFDELAAYCDEDWLQAYSRLHGATSRLNLGELIQCAWQRYAEGSAEIALRYLAEAERRAQTPIERAIAQIQAQGLRIALLRFEEAAQCTSPPEGIPQWMQGFLFQSIGWGAAMINQPQRAEPFLEEARKRLSLAAGSREHLYLLNISALNRYRLGDMESALQWENEIERALNKAPEEDWRLIYLNALNTARLLRAQGSLADAIPHFELAYETHEGVRSEGDRIYMNALNAQNLRTQSDFHSSFRAWLRVALHWVSMSTPEALPRRTASAIIQPPPNAHRMPESISAAVIERLHESAHLVGDTLPADACEPEPGRIPVFVTTDAVRHMGAEGAIAFALGGEGWGLLASNQLFPPIFNGPHWNRLCQLLTHWIHHQTSVDTRKVKAWILDDQFGCEMPVHAYDLLQCALRWRLDRLFYENKELRFSPDRMQALLEAARVTYSPGLARIVFDKETCHVGHKRYRSDRRLGEIETRIVKMIQSQPTVIQMFDEMKHSMDWPNFMSYMDRLQRDHILLLRWSMESLHEELKRLGVDSTSSVAASRRLA